MNHDYVDIRSRIAEPPKWWDERTCPRYCDFAPDKVADIYADEAALVLITCQECGKEYRVAFTFSTNSKFEIASRYYSNLDAKTAMEKAFEHSLARDIRERTIHYGDPPNACDDSCAAGASMNSEPRRVLEYWRRTKDLPYSWVRESALEINIEPDWVKE